MIKRRGASCGENGGHQQTRPVELQPETCQGETGRFHHQQRSNRAEKSGCYHPDAGPQAGRDRFRHLGLRELDFLLHKIAEIGEKIGQRLRQPGVPQSFIRHGIVSTVRTARRCGGLPQSCRGSCS